MLDQSLVNKLFFSESKSMKKIKLYSGNWGESNLVPRSHLPFVAIGDLGTRFGRDMLFYSAHNFHRFLKGAPVLTAFYFIIFYSGTGAVPWIKDNFQDVFRDYCTVRKSDSPRVSTFHALLHVVFRDVRSDT